MKRRFFTILALLALSGPAAMAADLGDVHRDIVEDHPAVTHMPAAELQRRLDDGDDLLLFDVREADEFAVSHIGDAIRVPPEISADDFFREFGADVAGRTVIFYCSVGRRSSILAEQVQDGLEAAGARGYNLQNGIFGWHNQAMPLASEQGQTPYVHPYNWLWSRYLEHRELTRYNP